MGIEIRPIVADELERYMDLCHMAFGGKPEEGEAERITEVIGLDRVHAAFDDGRMVGTEAAYGLRLTVPGTPTGDPTATEPPGREIGRGAEPPGIPTAGLSRVSVAATHRRRGILTGLIGAHFADAVDRGEALSALWASELPIYGRFGYGPAADLLQVSYDNRKARIRPPDRPVDLAFAEGDEATELLPILRERDRRRRPGHFHRSPTWWRLRRFTDHEFQREGASPRRTVIARRRGEPVGYATYRYAPRWTDHDLPDGEVRVIEAVGDDLDVRHTLWWYLSNVDLHPNVRFWSLPVDTELPWLATDPRAMVRHLTDGLQVRVLDVIAALEGRSWAADGQLVFAVDDASHRQAGWTYRLTAEAGRAIVERTDDRPELRLHPAALGALYLGSRPATALAVAGWLEAEPTVRDRTDRLFGWSTAAWCDESF